MNVVTMVELDTRQIRYLIDVLYNTNSTLTQELSILHNVDDVALEKQLQIYLGSALAEL